MSYQAYIPQPYGGRQPYRPSYGPDYGQDQQSVLAALLAQIMEMRQAAQEQVAAQAVQQAPNYNPMSYYGAYGPNAPYLGGLSPLARFKDMGYRDAARGASGAAAVEAVKQQQALQEIEDAKKLNEFQSNAERTIQTPYGKAERTFLPDKKSMYIGPKGGAPLQGEALTEVFQRAANAGSPNAGIGSIPKPQPGYPGGGEMTEKEESYWEASPALKKYLPKR